MSTTENGSEAAANNSGQSPGEIGLMVMVGPTNVG